MPHNHGRCSQGMPDAQVQSTQSMVEDMVDNTIMQFREIRALLPYIDTMLADKIERRLTNVVTDMLLYKNK
jgi:hypothetical protein